MEVAWLEGTSARFNPAMEIIGPAGDVIAREGSNATGGCGSPEGGWYVDFATPIPQEPEPQMTAEP